MKIKKRDFLLIPNLLSLFRIVLLPFILWYYLTDSSLYIVFGLLTLSWITDVLDGFVARRFNMISELGKILDPLADKVTQVCILIALGVKECVPLFIVLIILTKELLMLIGAIFLKKVLKDNIIPANYWGKSATGAFYLSATLIIFEIPYALVGIYITLVLMVIAFITYSMQLKRIFNSKKNYCPIKQKQDTNNLDKQ